MNQMWPAARRGLDNVQTEGGRKGFPWKLAIGVFVTYLVLTTPLAIVRTR